MGTQFTFLKTIQMSLLVVLVLACLIMASFAAEKKFQNRLEKVVRGALEKRNVEAGERGDRFFNVSDNDDDDDDEQDDDDSLAKLPKTNVFITPPSTRQRLNRARNTSLKIAMATTSLATCLSNAMSKHVNAATASSTCPTTMTTTMMNKMTTIRWLNCRKMNVFITLLSMHQLANLALNTLPKTATAMM